MEPREPSPDDHAALALEPASSPPSGPLLPRRHRRLYLAAEFALLFVAVPVLLYVFRRDFGRYIIPSLLGVGLACTLLLLFDPSFDRKRLWNTDRFGARLQRILQTFLPLAALLALVVVVTRPDLLLRFPREEPRLWLLVLFFYPVLSVYPQELIFRTFLFHRYRALFPRASLRIAVSGLAFGLAHLFFANWLAPVLTTLGGVLFARTYARTHSTLQSSLEHGLWGDFLFTLGLGWYFYGGSIAG